MTIGETRTVEIPSRPRLVRTELLLKPGEYAMEASGSWTDNGHAPCGPEGYPSDNGVLRATEWLRRTPHADWFALIGRVGSGRSFVIGRSARLRVDVAGELVCYANDAWLMYFNNKGSVTLAVRRAG